MRFPQPLQDAHRTIEGTDLPVPLVEELTLYRAFVLGELEPTAFEVDRRARPYLAHHDQYGGDPETVVLNAAHREALRKALASGLASGPVEGRHPWWQTFALGYLTTDVGTFCSATVTLATIYSLAKFGSPELRERFLPRLLEEGGSWQGATWATEPQGGSDLGANRTKARPQGGERYLLDGEKYFCSNVGAGCAVVTARPEGAAEGAKGVRLFFVPARRDDGTANWRIRRLKEKLGTVSVPTGEVSLIGSDAYLLGTDAEGIIPTMEMLNVSRICNAVGSAGLLQRAFEIAAEHAETRWAFGRVLRDHPLMAQELARLAVEASAAAVLSFEPAFAFDKVWKERPSRSPSARLLRFSTHAAKLVTAEQAVHGACRAMEVLGGAGYLEEYPVAKLVRDALVLPVWEGGANCQALDAAEISGRSRPEAVWLEEARAELGRVPSEEVRVFLKRRLDAGDVPAQNEPAARSRLAALAELRQMTRLLDLEQRSRGEDPLDAARARALPELFAFFREGKPGGAPNMGAVQDVLRAS